MYFKHDMFFLPKKHCFFGKKHTPKKRGKKDACFLWSKTQKKAFIEKL